MKAINKYIAESAIKFTVYLMCGCPGSGKSTWCKRNHPDLPVVSRDIIRAELGYTKNADEKAVLSRDAEIKVTNAEYTKIDEYCNQKQSFIVDDTNTGRFRQQMIDYLHQKGAFIIGVNMNTSKEECIKNRDGQIPKDAMERIWSRKIDIKPYEVDKLIIGKYV